MKISIERSVLLKAVAQAQSVVERRNTIPILSNVLIEADANGVILRATDLDIEVLDRAPAGVDRPGSTTANAVTLHDIVRKLPEGALVNLSDDPAAGRLTVQAGRSTFSLATLPREDFPQMASSEYAINFAAPSAELRRLFDKAKFAISTEETRYYLNGVYLHVAQGEGGEVLRCVATDGHRLARIDAALPEGARGMPGVIIPRKTVGELRKLLDGDTTIAVSVSLAFLFGFALSSLPLLRAGLGLAAQVSWRKTSRADETQASLNTAPSKTPRPSVAIASATSSRLARPLRTTSRAPSERSAKRLAPSRTGGASTTIRALG